MLGLPNRFGRWLLLRVFPVQEAVPFVEHNPTAPWFAN